MSDAAVQVFNHHAMATVFQVRIADQERGYTSQAARAAFDVADHLETLLSRFDKNSEISQVAALAPGEKLRLSEPVFGCLAIAREMESATRGAFCIAAAALRTQTAPPRWSLVPAELSIRCDAGKLEFDLGGIGKGFALDRMAEELVNWECRSFLLVAGGSSVLTGAAPDGKPGWSSGLGDDPGAPRYWLSGCSLSGSGIATKGRHITDPRTGVAAQQRSCAWALASSAAESDALSTACMVLNEEEIAGSLAGRADWLVFLNDLGEWRHYGGRPVPIRG